MYKWFVLICSLILVLVPSAFAGPKVDAKYAGTKYVQAQMDNNWKKACKMLSKRALSDWAGGSIEACIDNFATNGFTREPFSVQKVVVYQNTKRAIVSVRMDKDWTWKLFFVRESGVYKLDRDLS